MSIEFDTLADWPFGALRRVRRAGGDDLDPRVLLVSPVSGHRAALLEETARDLAARHDVHIVEWADAADVPVSAGRFGWDELIGYIVAFLQRIGSRAHAICMSQSGLPTLTAAAAMAAAGDPARPRSLTIMGGLLDTTINPTPMNRLAAGTFGNAFARENAANLLLKPVPEGRQGHGRLVYPGSTQRAALEVYLLRRMGPGRLTLLAAFQHFLLGNGSDEETNRSFYNAFLDVVDVPGELYLETMDAVFASPINHEPRPLWRGDRIDLVAIRDIALMTVEAERDDISGAGQTRCAHTLCRAIPDGARADCVAPMVGHLGMFHGLVWRATVMPRFEAFVRRAEAAG